MPKGPKPAQEEIDFLMPFPESRPLLRPDEVARCLDRTPQHVYDLISEGKLEAHAPTDREKQRYRITRRSVLAELAESALYRPQDHLPRVLTLLRTLKTREEITAAIRQLTHQLTNV